MQSASRRPGVASGASAPVLPDQYPERPQWKRSLERLLHNPLATAGAVVFLLFVLIAVFAPQIAPDDPTKQHYDLILAGPSAAHALGNDALGRDVLSRLIWGARISLSVGVFAQAIILVIGLTIGTIAGVAGGRIDNLLMRFTDVVYAFPDLLLVILFRAALGSNIYLIFLAIALAHWTGMARLVRAQILTLRELPFAEAARAIGATPPRPRAAPLPSQCTGPAHRVQHIRYSARDLHGGRAQLHRNWGHAAHAQLGQHDLGRRPSDLRRPHPGPFSCAGDRHGHAGVYLPWGRAAGRAGPPQLAQVGPAGRAGRRPLARRSAKADGIAEGIVEGGSLRL